MRHEDLNLLVVASSLSMLLEILAFASAHDVLVNARCGFLREVFYVDYVVIAFIVGGVLVVLHTVFMHTLLGITNANLAAVHLVIRLMDFHLFAIVLAGGVNVVRAATSARTC